METEMTNKRYGQICLRIGLLAAIVMALFWGIWSLFAPVPDHSTLVWIKEVKWTIGMSRWWDIPMAFALINVYGWIGRDLWLWGKKSGASEDDLVAGLGVGLVVGLRYVLARQLWAKVGSWLVAKDVQ